MLGKAQSGKLYCLLTGLVYTEIRENDLRVKINLLIDGKQRLRSACQSMQPEQDHSLFAQYVGILAGVCQKNNALVIHHL